MSKRGLFINTATVSGNEYDPDLSNNTSTVETVIFNRASEPVCIMVCKIVSSCQSRHCFSTIEFELPCGILSLADIRFGRGELSHQKITPLENRPNFARVIFDVTIPLTIHLKKTDGTNLILSEHLPVIHNDILLYHPQSTPEISFTLYPETRSELLNPAIIDGTSLILSVGVFLKIVLAMPAQLQIKAFGYCPEPELCEDFVPPNLCEEFLNRPWDFCNHSKECLP